MAIEFETRIHHKVTVMRSSENVYEKSISTRTIHVISLIIHVAIKAF